MPEKTPLYEEHLKLDGKMVDFAGWELPIQYADGIISEHRAVRAHAGLFDVSHMGELYVSGEGSFDFLQNLLTNDISRVKSGRAVYSPMCYEDGGTVDDLIVYPQPDRFFVVVNASNVEKDYKWISSRAPAGVKVENASSAYAQIALQGPEAAKIFSLAGAPQEACSLPYFGCGTFSLLGSELFIAATGYTGERGFEIYLPCDKAPALWRALIDAGAAPAGLGARDTLRFEACLPLYGHELSEKISPLQAGLGRFVKLEKKDFIGKNALFNEYARGLKRSLIGLELHSRAIARAGTAILSGDRECGFVTSGGFCPTLNKSMALAIIDTNSEGPFSAVVRGKAEAVSQVPIPFYNNTR